MRYLLLICTEESADLAMSPDEMSARLAKYAAFGGEMAQRGVLQAGARLYPTTDSTTVRWRTNRSLADVIWSAVVNLGGSPASMGKLRRIEAQYPWIVPM